MTVLGPGGNAPVNPGEQILTVDYSTLPGADIDVSAFLLRSDGKVRGDADMCFYGQKRVHDGAVEMTDSAAGRAVFALQLDRIEAAVEKIALTATIHENKAAFAAVPVLNVVVSGGIEAPIATTGMQETALILGEFYRRNETWKYRCIAQGFAGGLEPLAKHFGVEVAAPAVAATPPPAPIPVTPAASPPKVSLTKITLDKSRPTISLEKGAGEFGEIKINLNWNSAPSKGFFSRNKAIDLDVGCLFELQNGDKGCIQALGNAFGEFDRAPFIRLMGDDRTGAVTDGEWLHINGKQWKEIRRALVYAFIYDGAPNWAATDGVVTLYVPGQAPIEIRMNEEGGTRALCAIALLENVDGNVKFSRKVEFYKSQKEADEAYNWGMRWARGSK